MKYLRYYLKDIIFKLVLRGLRLGLIEEDAVQIQVLDHVEIFRVHHLLRPCV